MALIWAGMSSPASTPRPPVSYYAAPRPTYAAPSARYTPPAARPPPGPPSGDWSALDAFANSEAGQKQIFQNQPQPQQEQPSGFWGSPFGKGLGFVINNPVTRVAMMPLNIIDTGRKAAVLGVEQGAEALAGGPDWLRGAVERTPLSGIFNTIDTSRTEADPRSNWQKLKPGSDYGFGQLLDPDQPAWLNKGEGLAGDIGLDPLTYVTGGASRLVQGATHTEEALKGLQEATAGLKAAREAGDAAKIAQATERLGMAEDYVARAPKLGERVFEEALPHNRSGRIQMLGELAKTPEGRQFLTEMPEQATRGATRGFQTMSQEAKDLLRISEPGLKLRGFETMIPGTGKIAEALSAGGGLVRQGVSELPGAERKVANIRVPKGLLPSYNVLSRGAEGNVMKEATTVALHDMMREGTGAQLGRGQRIIANGVKKFFKGNSEDSIRQLTREAETLPERNGVNEMLSDMLGTYQKITGKAIDPEYLKNPDTYFPHVLDPHFRRALGRMAKDGNQSALDFMKHLNFIEDDLLEEPKFFADNLMEGSGYISKARKFGTNPKTGEAQTFKIGGTDVTFGADNVEHLNEQLSKAFPQYKGDFYDTDPTRVMLAYNKSLSRQAGRDLATRRLYETGNPLMGAMTGDIDATRKAIDEALSQQGASPLLGTAQGKYVPGEIPEVPPTPTVPGSFQERAPIEKLRTAADEAADPNTARVLNAEADRLQTAVDATRIGGVEPSDYFVTTKGRAATAERDVAAKRAKTYATAIGGETRTAEEKLRSRISEVRETIIDPLKTNIKKVKGEITQINRKIKVWGKTITDMGDLNPENFEDFSNLVSRVGDEITNGEVKLKRTAASWKGKATKAQRKAEAEIRTSLENLRDVRDQAWAKVKSAPEEMQIELTERERVLNQPVRDAHEALLWKEMGVDVPYEQATYDQAIQDAMTGLDAGTDPEELLNQYRQVAADAKQSAEVTAQGTPLDSPEVVAARQKYSDIVQGIHALGANYTKRGRMPRLAKKLWQDAVAAKAELNRLEGAAPDITEFDDAVNRMNKLTGDIATAKKGGSTATAALPEGMTQEEVYQAFAEGRLNIGDLGKGLGPGDVPRLTAERNKLARQFRSGGKFYKESQARDVLSEMGKYAKNVEDATVEERAALDRAIKNRQTRQESIIWAQAEREGQDPINRLRHVTGVGEDPSNLETMGWGLGQTRTPEAITTPPQEAAWLTKTRLPSGELAGIPAPRTEQEALQSMRSQIEFGGAEQIGARAQAKNTSRTLAAAEATAPERLAAQKADIVALNTEDMERALGPIEERVKTYTNLASDLTDKKNLVAKRNEAQALRDQIRTSPTAKFTQTHELSQILDDLDAVAKANPYLDDPKLNQVESLLHTHRAELERIGQARLRMSDLDRVTEDAANGKLGDVMIATLNNNWRALHNGPVNTGDLIMDAELYKRFTNMFEVSRQPKLFGRTFNAFTNLFKTYATLSPGFHVRNAIGGIFMNTSDGVALARQLEGAQLWQKFTRGGEDWLDKQPKRIQDSFSAALASGAGGRYEEAGVLAQTENRLYNVVSSNPATRLGQRAGTRVEGGLRLGMALDSIDNGSSIQDALQRITRIHFDYSQVSDIDETMKRIIPFWTFMSRNLPLQIEQMWTKPRTYAYYNSLIRNFSLPDAPFTPDYWTRQGAWNTGVKIAGNPLYLQPDLGFTRMQSDLKMVEDTLSGENPGGFLANTNPLIGATMDFINKRDSFYNRNFDPTDYTKMGGVVGAPITMLAKALGQTNEAGQVSENFTNYLQSLLPPLNQTIRMFPGSTGGDSSAQTWVKRARYGGLPIQLLTPDTQDSEYWRQYRAMQDEQTRQQAMLKEAAS